MSAALNTCKAQKDKGAEWGGVYRAEFEGFLTNRRFKRYPEGY
jgi:hypothetical protein